jgi:hypothetical protein
VNKEQLDELYRSIKADNEERPVGIMIATPMYGGMCHGDYCIGAVKAVGLLRSLGFIVSYQAMFNESLITRARNNLAVTFLNDPNMDYLMFIDSDIGFGEQDILRLVLADKPISAAAYPRKRINWSMYNKAIKAGKDNPRDWTGDFIFNTVGINPTEDAWGMIEVTHAPTGFMLIHRKVFETLQNVVEEYEDVIDGKTVKGWDFFKVGVGKNGRYTSEDYWFCNEWRETGGKIYMNPYIHLTHTGSYTFAGNLARMGTEAL